MAQIRNISDDDRLVPDLSGRLVMAGQVVDVNDADVHSYTRQVDVWAPVDKAAQLAHDSGELELAEALGATEARATVPVSEAPTVTDTDAAAAAAASTEDEEV